MIAERVGFEHRPGSRVIVLCLMQDTLLLQCLSPPRSINGCRRQNAGEYLSHALFCNGLSFCFPCRHLVAVVKAWVECSDSDSDSEDEQAPSTTGAHAARGLPSDRSEQQAPGTSLRIHMPDTGHVVVNPNNDNIEKLQNVLYGSARFIGRMQHRRKLPKFHFEKYITYLDKVSRNVGFSIGVVLVTWELVSTVFFFLISLIALFVQESIFGKAESTITI